MLPGGLQRQLTLPVHLVKQSRPSLLTEHGLNGLVALGQRYDRCTRQCVSLPAHAICMKRHGDEDPHAAPRCLPGDAILEEGVIPIERLLPKKLSALHAEQCARAGARWDERFDRCRAWFQNSTLSGWNEITFSHETARHRSSTLPTVTDFSRSSAVRW